MAPNALRTEGGYYEFLYSRLLPRLAAEMGVEEEAASDLLVVWFVDAVFSCFGLLSPSINELVSAQHETVLRLQWCFSLLRRRIYGMRIYDASLSFRGLLHHAFSATFCRLLIRAIIGPEVDISKHAADACETLEDGPALTGDDKTLDDQASAADEQKWRFVPIISIRRHPKLRRKSLSRTTTVREIYDSIPAVAGLDAGSWFIMRWANKALDLCTFFKPDLARPLPIVCTALVVESFRKRPCDLGVVAQVGRFRPSATVYVNE